ncbi:MAG: IclR family transcriptional regulator [Actinobacteria bacterium]|nr:MAG: IclR family transcriptional regulator [Actinomycetota bacterium]
MDRISDVGVIDKAMAVIAAVEREPMALAALVDETGLARPTVHRLAVALEAHGLLRRDDEGRFALGPRAVALGRAAADAFPLRDVALPALRDLRDKTQESVQLYVRDGDRRVCVASLQSPHGLRTIVDEGAALPLRAGSGGAVLLERPAVLERGWAESVGEREAGVASVSAPIFDRGRVIAAVSVSGPIERLTRTPGKRYARAVMAAARTVERAL